MVPNVQLVMDLRPGTAAHAMFWQELAAMEHIDPDEAWLESREPVRLPAQILCVGMQIVFEYRLKGLRNSVLVQFRIEQVQYWPQGEQTRVHVQLDEGTERILLQDLLGLGWSL